MQVLGKSWKLQFRFFRPESHGIWPRSWKINQLIAAFVTHCTRFWPLYALSLFTVRLGSICCLV